MVSTFQHRWHCCHGELSIDRLGHSFRERNIEALLGGFSFIFVFSRVPGEGVESERATFICLSSHIWSYITSSHDVCLFPNLSSANVSSSRYSNWSLPLYFELRFGSPCSLVLLTCPNHLILLHSKESCYFSKPNVFLISLFLILSIFVFYNQLNLITRIFYQIKSHGWYLRHLKSQRGWNSVLMGSAKCCRLWNATFREYLKMGSIIEEIEKIN